MERQLVNSSFLKNLVLVLSLSFIPQSHANAARYCLSKKAIHDFVGTFETMTDEGKIIIGIHVEDGALFVHELAGNRVDYHMKLPLAYSQSAEETISFRQKGKAGTQLIEYITSPEAIAKVDTTIIGNKKTVLVSEMTYEKNRKEIINIRTATEYVKETGAERWEIDEAKVRRFTFSKVSSVPMTDVDMLESLTFNEQHAEASSLLPVVIAPAEKVFYPDFKALAALKDPTTKIDISLFRGHFVSKEKFQRYQNYKAVHGKCDKYLD